jgi:DNA-binding response OmpR family regulator
METNTTLNVLLVEDDPALREMLQAHLCAEGWVVRSCDDGLRALAACVERRPDIVVLDVMLPGCNGLEICTSLRSLYAPSPGVVMLTARDAEIDVILGLEVGADDYVTKPCRPRELIARVRALARRVAHSGQPPSRLSPPPNDTMLEHGALRVELDARTVTVQDRAVRLTPTEFALLALLVRKPNRVFTRMELLKLVWDSTHEAYARNVDCHITRLRRKLETAGLVPVPILTSHGTGYYFSIPPSPAPGAKPA